MGRPLGKEFFGPLDNTASADPSQDGKDASGRTTTGATYRKKDKGYNIPVYKARIPGGSLASPTFDMDVGGDAAETPYIIAQKGSRKYRVHTSDGDGNCILVNDDGSSQIGPGEMVIAGFVGTDTGDTAPVFIQKLTKHYATDFNGNRYKWLVEPTVGGDSSLANFLRLVPADTNIS